jgi:hypothetical protein
VSARKTRAQAQPATPPLTDTRRIESTPDLPPLPREPAARRRAIRLRGW